MRERYLRFTKSDRIEHWVQVASFTILAVTGLVQKYATAQVSLSLITSMGGIERVRIIHRIAAIVLMVAVVYHIGAVGYRLFVLRVRPSILPGLDDVRAVWQSIRFNLGLAEARPQQGRYTFDEKFEYWAFVWGTVIMVLTGFMMWNPIATARFFPGQFIPAAKAAHGGEALLAVLAIIVWHIYHVHVKHFNRSMFTGYLTREEMLEDHPLELAEIEAARPQDQTVIEQVRRRQRFFFPAYGGLAAALLVGIYAFVSFEETAITTLPPRQQVVVFAPLTPTPLPTPFPTNTPSPTIPRSWEAGIDSLFVERCGTCHGNDSSLGGLDLGSYQGTLAGGNSGPAVVPGDPDASLTVIRLSAGDHPGQLSGEELALVRAWIEAGAPEN